MKYTYDTIIEITELNKKYKVVTTKHNSKMWYLAETSDWHREIGPAVVYGSGAEAWYRYGLLHREDGPAYDNKRGRVEYWLNGNRLKATNQKEFEIEKLTIILE